MIFEQIPVGGDRNFAYLIGDERTRQAAVVDPAYLPDNVLQRASHHKLEVAYLINTHDHHDHSGGNETVLSKTRARLLAGAAEGFVDGQLIELGDVVLKLIHTPGHTTDSICVLASSAGETDKLITGDTLFVGKVGGTGFGDDARDEYHSLHDKLMVLPDETEVWPGHDVGVAPSSTIGNEKKTNPFILQESFEEFVDLKRNWLEYKREHGID